MPQLHAPSIWVSLSTALLGTAAGCLPESSHVADLRGTRANRQAASVTRVERPQRFQSEWDATNWRARESAFAKEGLFEVSLPRLISSEVPPVTIAPGSWCQLIESSADDGRRFFFSLSGEFGMTADGTLYCLQIDTPALGNKEVVIDGPPPNCTGGAFQPTVPWSSIYEIPPGTKAGSLKHLTAPSYNVMHRYTESCPPLP